MAYDYIHLNGIASDTCAPYRAHGADSGDKLLILIDIKSQA